MRLIYSLSHNIEAICSLSVFFSDNKWTLMGTLCSFLEFHTPLAMIDLSVKQEQMGVCTAVMNSFGVIGQQASISYCGVEPAHCLILALPLLDFLLSWQAFLL
jgi:hypothetical protein